MVSESSSRHSQSEFAAGERVLWWRHKRKHYNDRHLGRGSRVRAA